MFGIIITFVIVIYDFYKEIRIGHKKDQKEASAGYLPGKSI